MLALQSKWRPRQIFRNLRRFGYVKRNLYSKLACTTAVYISVGMWSNSL